MLSRKYVSILRLENGSSSAVSKLDELSSKSLGVDTYPLYRERILQMEINEMIVIDKQTAATKIEKFEKLFGVEPEEGASLKSDKSRN